MKHRLNTDSEILVRVSSVFNLWLLFPVNFFRLLQLRLGRFEIGALFRGRTEKARFIAFVTSGADLFHLNQERVAIAIERHIFDRLRMAARLAFHPELLPRTAP